MAVADDAAPKLANYFLKTPISEAEIIQLAKWDVVILGMQVQDTNPNIFSELRRLNPKIKIIAYLSTMEFPINNYQWLESQNGPWHKMYQQIISAWWLKDGSEQIHSIWPGNNSFNLTDYCPSFKGEKFNQFLPRFVKEELMTKNYWDGVFFDNALESIKDTNNGQVDIDNNGRVDEKEFADTQWRAGVLKMLSETRWLLGPDKIIMINSSSYGRDFINGRLYEDWPTPWRGNWSGEMKDYQRLENQIKFNPPIIVINANTNNTGQANDYQKVRLGVASTLLGNGYFAFDWGTQDHSQLWWYDEYDANLGQPIGQPKNLLNGNSTVYSSGVWRRDYTQGIVLVNSTDKNQTVNLDDGVYEKLRGYQDPTINNGAIITSVVLAPQDGLILLRKLELKTLEKTELNGFTFNNGAYVRVFDRTGKVKRTGFYAYDQRFVGGVKIINQDINNDGQKETIVGEKNKIKIYQGDDSLFKIFYPFGEKYSGEIDFAVGNVIGDSQLEMVVGAGRGLSPQVKIFASDGKELNAGFLAYDKNFTGGVKVTVGDLNNDSYGEIITGTGFGGGPQVRIFSGQGKLFDPGFFAYDKKFRGGVNVATGDLNNDGKDEIITGAGIGGGSHVRIYDNKGRLVDPGFFAFDEQKREGVKVSAADVDGDGRVEIVAYK